MKKILFIALSAVLLLSCDSYVTTTTPANDARKISAKLQSARTPKEYDEAASLLDKYYAAYEKEVYEGKRNMEDLKELLTLIDY